MDWLAMSGVTNSEDIYLSVVIPAFNEVGRIEKSIRDIENFLLQAGNSFEIIVIDDGSLDRTWSLLTDLSEKSTHLFPYKNDKNEGKGYSVKRGVLLARGKFILFSDSDLSTPIEEITNLLPWFDKGYDIVIGSRGLKQSNIIIHQSLHRENMGRVFNWLVRLLFMTDFKDTQCGFKCFKRETVREIFSRQTVFGFCFDVELLLIGKLLGYKIKECPVRWINSPNSKVHTVKDPLFMIKDLLKIKLNHINGRYSK